MWIMLLKSEISTNSIRKEIWPAVVEKKQKCSEKCNQLKLKYSMKPNKKYLY